MSDDADLPECPEDVRLEMWDGRIVSVECVWRGIDPDTGCDVWTVTQPIDVANVRAVRIRSLPASCMVQLEW